MFGIDLSLLAWYLARIFKCCLYCSITNPVNLYLLGVDGKALSPQSPKIASIRLYNVELEAKVMLECTYTLG